MVKAFSVVRQTECAYCLNTIEYAMVETVDPGPPGGFIDRGKCSVAPELIRAEIG